MSEPTEPVPPARAAPVGTEGGTVDAAPLAELLADVTRRNEALAAAAALWEYRAMQAEERLAQLEAGPMAGDVDQDAAAASKTLDPRQSAWRRWWRRMSGGAVDLS